mmetsp:Transcript_26926/g.56845  ORF Transcript_26926/g.56845 Transcript_26926/m.56845 type:complete len:451 (+) Transcript_26926:331-1683(+)|eukprot:CAMPEP_0183701896 /NCGR_PEP_ID=MMETSP0737-20130205/125_1 /TAXON_ID=385413 /ORGANISM="Thalassiosira miniscula, Strain CCMP1093" /LENGTH=450 /DNA_ID=CAMNT_0025928393 /DNA_START=256 /DNA_END=1608 /DNA_ORIENTATION=+
MPTKSLRRAFSKKSETTNGVVGQSQESSSFQFPPAVLRLKVLHGSNLYQTDVGSKIDPYVEVTLGSDSSRSIAVLRGGRDCTFNWSVTFPFDPSRVPDGLNITVWDQDFGTKDDVVGHCTISIQSILKCETKARAFRGEARLIHTSRLSGRDKNGGSLDIELYWEKNSVFQTVTTSLRESMLASMALSHDNVLENYIDKIAAIPIARNYCVTNFNKLGGVAQAIIDKHKMSDYTPFRTYRLRLWHVDSVFHGFRKGWNQDYKAAQQIYGPKLPSKTMRAGLRFQNFMCYSNDHVNKDHDNHEILRLADLYKMLQSYHLAAASPRHNSKKMLSSCPRYTYVIMPDSHMRFSITSKKIATDFLSKHALHAGAATEVVYSGEFFFDQCSKRAKETGKVALVIDNNSGTFGPPKEKLDLLKLLMQLNFGTDLPILALDREDPLLKELSDVNGIE